MSKITRRHLSYFCYNSGRYKNRTTRYLWIIEIQKWYVPFVSSITFCVVRVLVISFVTTTMKQSTNISSCIFRCKCSVIVMRNREQRGTFRFYVHCVPSYSCICILSDDQLTLLLLFLFDSLDSDLCFFLRYIAFGLALFSLIFSRTCQNFHPVAQKCDRIISGLSVRVRWIDMRSNILMS